MKKHTVLFALGALLLAFVGCGDKSTNSSGFSNSLTLGTNMDMNKFMIVGETTSFPDSSMIYWRLESSDDMNGSTVEIAVSKNGSPVSTLSFTNPSSYGHIMLSGFKHTFGRGSFRATGRLATGGKTVATKDYTVQ